MQTRGAALEIRRGFLLNRDHGHINAAAARAFEHQERKIAVACDEAPVFDTRCFGSLRHRLFREPTLGRLDEAY